MAQGRAVALPPGPDGQHDQTGHAGAPGAAGRVVATSPAMGPAPGVCGAIRMVRTIQFGPAYRALHHPIALVSKEGIGLVEQAPKPYVQVAVDDVDIVVFDPEGRYDPEQYDRFVNFEQPRCGPLLHRGRAGGGGLRGRGPQAGLEAMHEKESSKRLGPSRTWPSRPSPVGCWRGSPRPGRLPPDRCPEEPVLGAFFASKTKVEPAMATKPTKMQQQACDHLAQALVLITDEHPRPPDSTAGVSSTRRAWV